MKVYELMKLLEKEPAGSRVQVTVIINDDDYQPEYIDRQNHGYFEADRKLRIESDDEKTYVDIIGYVS